MKSRSEHVIGRLENKNFLPHKRTARKGEMLENTNIN